VSFQNSKEELISKKNRKIQKNQACFNDSGFGVVRVEFQGGSK